MDAPFPYFGTKKKVAPVVWKALGDVKHYLEPFFGSGAVLLNRPNYDAERHMETICDADGFVSNTWRGLQYNPDEVAKWCDWPVNHADLQARKKKLLEKKGYLLENLVKDDEWFDAKMAGYWIWSASCWIGAGMMNPKQRPHISDAGVGVHKISLGQIPHIIDAGKGVHKISKAHEPNYARHVQEPFNDNLYIWFRALSERLRRVRVVCGDWSRICGGNWHDSLGLCGIFFDPPYGDKAERCEDLYDADSLTVAHDVREWCKERSKLKSYRIVLAGYYEEHEELLKHGWTAHKWTAATGYSNQNKAKKNNNRFREALFLSPHCAKKGGLFE